MVGTLSPNPLRPETSPAVRSADSRPRRLVARVNQHSAKPLAPAIANTSSAAHAATSQSRADQRSWCPGLLGQSNQGRSHLMMCRASSRQLPYHTFVRDRRRRQSMYFEQAIPLYVTPPTRNTFRVKLGIVSAFAAAALVIASVPAQARVARI